MYLKLFNQKSPCLIFLDVDECSPSLDNCHENSNCTNINGSFFCTCDGGYSGNGTVCDGKKNARAFLYQPKKTNWHLNFYLIAGGMSV